MAQKLVTELGALQGFLVFSLCFCSFHPFVVFCLDALQNTNTKLSSLVQQI